MPIDIERAQEWYSPDDSVHGFDHILRVYRMAEHLALAENADLEIVRVAALLHDSKGAKVEENSGIREEHHITSAEFAKEVLLSEGWQPGRIRAVEHAIRSHRFRNHDEEPQTIEAKCLFDSDKLDAIGAIGAARAIAYSVQAGEPLWAEPSRQFLTSGKKEVGEPHTPYHEYLFKLRNIQNQMCTTTGRQLAIERTQFLERFFNQLAAESRGER